MSQQQHLERPLILHLRHVAPKDCETPTQVAIAINTMIDALNQILPGHGTYAITEAGDIVVRGERESERESLEPSTGRDPNVSFVDVTPTDSADSDSDEGKEVL